jgi:hypothetical protein
MDMSTLLTEVGLGAHMQQAPNSGEVTRGFEKLDNQRFGSSSSECASKWAFSECRWRHTPRCFRAGRRRDSTRQNARYTYEKRIYRPDDSYWAEFCAGPRHGSGAWGLFVAWVAGSPG